MPKRMKLTEIGDPMDPTGDYYKCIVEGPVYPLGGSYPLGVRANTDGTLTVLEDSCDMTAMNELLKDGKRNSPGGMVPLLLEHCSETGPIGCVTDTYFKDNWLHARAELHIPKALNAAREIREKFRDGRLNGFSIGYDILPNPRDASGNPTRKFVEISAVEEAFFENTFSSVKASKKKKKSTLDATTLVPGRTYGLDPSGALASHPSPENRTYVFQTPPVCGGAYEVRAAADADAPAPTTVPPAPAPVRAPVTPETSDGPVRVYTRGVAAPVSPPAEGKSISREFLASAPESSPDAVLSAASSPTPPTAAAASAPLADISKQQQQQHPPTTTTPTGEESSSKNTMADNMSSEAGNAAIIATGGAPPSSDTSTMVADAVPASGDAPADAQDSSSIVKMMEHADAMEKMAKAKTAAAAAAAAAAADDMSDAAPSGGRAKRKRTDGDDSLGDGAEAAAGDISDTEEAEEQDGGGAEEESMQMQMLKANNLLMKELKNSRATVKRRDKDAADMALAFKKMVGSMNEMLATPPPAAPPRAGGRSVKASRGAAAAAAGAGTGLRGDGDELYQSAKRRRYETAEAESVAEVRASVDRMPKIDTKSLNHMQRCLIDTFGSAFLHPDASSTGAERAREIYNGR
jgi:hypothetical protein